MKFYRAVKQLVLLFGTETWVLLVPMSQRIEEVPETVDEVKGRKAEVRFMAEGGNKQINSGSRDTTAPDLLENKAGNSGVMGGLADHLQ